jgi:hypothetical protein
MPDRVTTGQPLKIPAATWNALLSIVEAWDPRDRSLRAGPMARGGQVVIVRNDTGADVPRFGVLGIGAPIFPPTTTAAESFDVFRTGVQIIGVTPALTHSGRFVVAIEPIAANAVGKAIVAGVTPVRVDIVDERHVAADVHAGSTLLRSCDVGAPILWKESGTGQRWAIVRVEPAPRERVVAILGAATSISAYYQWRYAWHEAVFDRDSGSATYLQYIPRPGGLSSKDNAGNEVAARQAINRFEAHHPRTYGTPIGQAGHIGVDACPPLGVEESCPPTEVMMPRVIPILPNVAVELQAERDAQGGVVWTFQALNPIVFEAQAVSAS